MASGDATPGDVTPANVRKLLQSTAASREQRNFFEAFVALVFEPVEAAAFGDKEALLVVACDRSRLELQITANTSQMCPLAADFLEQCGVPDDSGARRFEAAALASRAHQASLWCRLKRIGSPRPVADVGFAVGRASGSLPGAVGELSVPGSQDYEALQKHASDNQSEPCLYGRSILPDRGGRAPTILEYNMAMVNSAKLLLSGLGFFRSLNFARPEDSILRMLKDCGADKCMVRALLTSDGLTQLSLRMHSSSSVVNEAGSDQLRQFSSLLDGDPVLVEYTMDSQGCSLAVGYSHATVDVDSMV